MKQDKFLPDNYTPAEDEPFMNERQVKYFRRKLIAWKNDGAQHPAAHEYESPKVLWKSIPNEGQTVRVVFEPG